MSNNISNKLILVVEDNLVNQKVISAMLEKLNHSVDIVANGQQALEKVNEHRYDIVFMDCQMPVMDGYAATREIRKLEEASGTRTPVVAMTANVLSEDQGMCFSAGMDDFMAKPILLDGLKDIIQKWCPEEDSNPRPSP